MAEPARTRGGGGWIGFAGVMLILAGLLDMVNGLWALDHKDTPADNLLYSSNLEGWGWFYLIVGVVLIVTGFFVFQRARWAVTLGVIVALLGAIANMFWIFEYPLASIVLVIVNVMVLYALVVYGDRDVYVD